MFTYKGTVLTLADNYDLTPEYIDSLADFEIKDNDVFVVTFPKSGNTVWTQRIMMLINAEDFLDKANQLTHQQMSWLEYRAKEDNYNTHPSPRLFCSHLLQPLMPKMLQIIIMINPKDVMVSYFHFSNNMKHLVSSERTVGDWKNSLTVAQSECFDCVYQERMKDVPLNVVWDISELQG
uniref:Sulfotransferase n=1 Tax=Sinocyclocheilus anshuiensis TaxID=1608454 RepID=A0A671SPK9_9TELE